MGIYNTNSNRRQAEYDGRFLVEQIAKAYHCKPSASGQYIDGSCPNHGRKGNFSVHLGDNGEPVFKCFAGCRQDDIITGLIRDGYWHAPGTGGPHQPRSTPQEDFAQFATGPGGENRSGGTTGGPRIKNPTAKANAQRACQKLLEERAKQERLDAAKEAWRIAHDCDPHNIPDDHPYNKERGGMWTGGDARRGYWPHNGEDLDALLLPFCDAEGKTWTLQAIGSKELKTGSGTARKVFMKGGLSRGSFYSFTPTADPGIKTFLIAEGFFTAQAACHCFLHQLPDDDERGATSCFIVAGSVNNLALVAYQLKTAHPAADIIILADEDQPEIAQEAARVSDGKVALPSAGLDDGAELPHGFDFWDLLNEHGAAAVIKAIETAKEPPPGEEPENLKDTAEAADREQAQREEERQEDEEVDALLAKLFTERRCSARYAADNEPAPLDFILDGYITKNIVCAFSGAGGGGKSYQCLKIGLAITSGHPIENFSTSKRGTVLYFTSEDPVEILDYRMHHLMNLYGFSQEEICRVEENFHPLYTGGLVFPIMGFDAKGNPVENKYSKLLRRAIERYDPDLVILDPKTDFYGINENANEDEAVWVNLLKSMVPDGKRTAFLVVSHIAKGLDENQRESPEAARGGSAFITACRAAMNYVPARDSEIKQYGLPEDTYKLLVTKSNWYKKAETVFFSKEEHGIPVAIDIDDIKTKNEAEKFEAAVKTLARLMGLLKPDKDGRRLLNKRQLERGEDAPDDKDKLHSKTRKALMEATGIKADRVPLVTLECIKRGYVKKTGGSMGGVHGKGQVYLEFVFAPIEEEEAEP